MAKCLIESLLLLIPVLTIAETLCVTKKNKMGVLKRLFGKKEPEKTTKKINNQDNLDGSRGDIILHFKNQIKNQIEWDKLEDVKFGMWLPSSENESLKDSGIIDKWNSIYKYTSTYWSYISADLLKTLGLLGDNNFRLNLPNEFQAFAFVTDKNEEIVLSLSQEKGIRLHFSENTSLDYRLNFLDSFEQYCKAWSELIKIKNGKIDTDLKFKDWWELNVKVSLETEKYEPLTGVGVIVK